MDIFWMSVAFLGPQNVPKSFAAETSPQTPLGSLKHSPEPLAGFDETYFKALTFKGRRGEARGRGKEVPK